MIILFQHPWLVGIIKTKSRQLHCGGSLIHPNWILTASHCFYDKAGNLWNLEENKLTAIFGTDDLGLDPSERAYKQSNHVEKPVLTYLVHENYQDGQAYNDVALALVSPVKFTQRIYPVCLPSVPIVFQNNLKNDAVDILGYSIKVPKGSMYIYA